LSHRCADGTHAADLAGVIEPPAHPGRDWPEAAMQQATAWLEAHVRQHPEQWLWMHRRWKDAPAAARGPVVASEAR
jgi:lauroyl/myristoyl acyltransferase